jgi:hypothetical protein
MGNNKTFELGEYKKTDVFYEMFSTVKKYSNMISPNSQLITVS